MYVYTKEHLPHTSSLIHTRTHNTHIQTLTCADRGVYKVCAFFFYKFPARKAIKATKIQEFTESESGQ